MSTSLKAVIVDRLMTTDRVVVLDLEAADGSAFPTYEAGAHIDVLLDRADLDSTLVRQYSLVGTPGEPHRYRIAVLRDDNSRGGSLAVHDLQVGQIVEISSPRNNFRLAPARHHRLFAGGIGITPILSMAHELDAAGGDYTLHYSARTAADVSFAELLATNPRVVIHLDDRGNVLDLPTDLGAPEPDTAVYVCGPGPFIDFVLDGAAALGWPDDALHKERFAASTAITEPGTGFSVKLATSNAEFQVGEDETILEVLERNGIEAPSSCQQGICGECVVKVLSGEPDHRDDILSDREHAEGLFTPCCSRANSATLELDL